MSDRSFGGFPLPYCASCRKQHKTPRQILARMDKYMDRQPAGPIADRLRKDIGLWFDCEDGGEVMHEMNERTWGLIGWAVAFVLVVILVLLL